MAASGDSMAQSRLIHPWNMVIFHDFPIVFGITIEEKASNTLNISKPGRVGAAGGIMVDCGPTCRQKIHGRIQGIPGDPGTEDLKAWGVQ